MTNIVRHYHLFWNNIRNFFTDIVFFAIFAVNQSDLSC
nr:MAG TPA: TMP repeat [Caudoviricetes sp.]DAS15672.1 MAG TPA: TMP repeat [Caudoviricetes sp.]